MFPIKTLLTAIGIISSLRLPANQVTVARSAQTKPTKVSSSKALPSIGL
ncbi:hypothetical protein [Microcoleus sp. bin38.metabat.b11b12b14.051]|nr:hypothetical protein [Microcoleus sp. bin38.metabat.b11b12b14.051]